MQLALSPVPEVEQEPQSCVLSFQPRADLVSTVRRFIEDFYAHTLDDPDLRSRVALALHELLENAVKYGKQKPAHVRVDVRPLGSRTRVCITTRNHAEPEDVAALDRAVAEMNAAPDPFSYYQSAMRRSAKLIQQSGLGLARIRAEAEMLMRFDYSDENEIIISAETDAPPAPEAA